MQLKLWALIERVIKPLARTVKMTVAIALIAVSAILGAIGVVLLQEAWSEPQNQATTPTKDGPAENQVSESSQASMANGEGKPFSVAGNDNVVSINQRGGITARNVINQAPRPELVLLSDSWLQKDDGNFRKVVRVGIESPYAVGQLLLEATASDIVNGDIHPVDVAQIQFGSNIADTKYYVEVQNPTGRYDIVIDTKKKGPVQLTYAFR